MNLCEMRVFGCAALALAIFIVPTSASCNYGSRPGTNTRGCVNETFAACINETVATYINKTLTYVNCGIETNYRATFILKIYISGNFTTNNSFQCGCFNTTDNQMRNISFTFDSSCDYDACCVRKSFDVGKEANNMEDNMRKAHKSDNSDPDNMMIVLRNLSQIIYTQKTLYEFSSGSSVREIEFSNGTKLDDARVVFNNKKIPWLKEAASIKPPPIPSLSRASPFQRLVGNRFLGISAFDETGKNLNVSRVKFSIDAPFGDITESCKKAIDDVTVENETFASAHCLDVTFHCVFHEDGKWPSKGCSGVTTDQGKLTCECTHTTVFAVLLSATVVTIPQSVKVVSYVTEVISIVFLMVTVFLLAKVRNRVRGDRVKIQICVASSLLCLHFVSVLHDAALNNERACEMIAVLTHYFLLCSALWMLMEGVTLLFKTTDTVMRFLNGKNAKKFAIFRFVFSFSVPALIVGISAAVGFSKKNELHYMPSCKNATENEHIPTYVWCWVHTDFLIGAVVIPIAIILLCCVLIIIRMFYVVFRMSSESENYKPTSQRRPTTSGDFADLQHVKAALKAILILFPVLGIPWILGFFTGIENGGVGTIFMYLNVIVNGLQGVMVFFVYCVIGKEVRTAILMSFTRKMYSVSSSIEFSTKQRASSVVPHITLSTNVGDNSSDCERSSNKSVDGIATLKL